MKYDETRLFSKLDAMNNKLGNIAETTAKQEEHFRAMNGTIERHEKMFKDLYVKTDANTNNIYTARGGLAGVKWTFSICGIVVTILSGLAISKSLGFW